MSEEEYEFYIKDQREDNMLEPQYHEESKGWAYKYCDFLTKNVDKDFNYVRANVLDVGCREFFTADYFQERYKNRITGIDICNAGLDFATSNMKQILDVDAHKLLETFKPNAFNLVMAFHSLEHMYDIELVIKNCAEVLKDRGLLYFAVPVPCKNERRGHWADIPDEEYMVKLCESVGLEKVFSKVFPPGIFRNEQEMVAAFRK